MMAELRCRFCNRLLSEKTAYGCPSCGSYICANAGGRAETFASCAGRRARTATGMRWKRRTKTTADRWSAGRNYVAKTKLKQLFQKSYNLVPSGPPPYSPRGFFSRDSYPTHPIADVIARIER